MGNTDSGDVGSNALDNDDTNWFQTDMDTSFSLSNKDGGTHRDLEKSAKPNANYRSFSVDRAMTPVSMVSPIMKSVNSHHRSYSVGKTITPSTPVSMVSPVMNSYTPQKQRYYAPTNFSTPVSMVSPVMKTPFLTPQLTYQNPNTNQNQRNFHNTIVNKNHITNQTSKRASSIAKTQPVSSYDIQAAKALQQAKRSYSTPRHALKNQSQVVYANYQTNFDPNHQLVYTKHPQNTGYAYIKPVTPIQQQANPIMYRNDSDNQVRSVYLRQNPAPKPVRLVTSGVHDRTAHQTMPVISQLYSVPTRKVNVERLPKLPTPAKNVTGEYSERSRKYGYNQQTQPVTHRSKNKSTQKPPQDIKPHRDIKYSGIAPTGNPTHYNQQYGSLLLDQPKVAKIPLNIFKKTSQQLATNQRSDLPTLIGDIEALKLIDLDAAGLSEYKNFVSNILPKYASGIQPIKTFKRSIPPISYSQAQLNKKANKPPKQPATSQNLLNYYQNPQFLKSTASLAQSKINGFSGYDNIYHNNQFNSVYLSGY